MNIAHVTATPPASPRDPQAASSSTAASAGFGDTLPAALDEHAPVQAKSSTGTAKQPAASGKRASAPQTGEAGGAEPSVAPDPSSAALLQIPVLPLIAVPVQAQADADAPANTVEDDAGKHPTGSTSVAQAEGLAQIAVLPNAAALTAGDADPRVRVPGREAAGNIAGVAAAHHAAPTIVAAQTASSTKLPDTAASAASLSPSVARETEKSGPGGNTAEKQAEKLQATPQALVPATPSVHTAAPSKAESDTGAGQTAAQPAGTDTRSGGQTSNGSSGSNADAQAQTFVPPVPAAPLASGVDGSGSPAFIPAFAAEMTAPASSSATAISQPASPGTHFGETAAADPLHAVSSAQLINRASGTEIRVGLRSDEFGSISIATSVSRGNVVAQIALDHGELSRALLSHVPGMEEKLGAALGLHARVELRDAAQAGPQGNAYNSGAGGSSGSGTGHGASPGQGRNTQTHEAALGSGGDAEAQPVAAQPAVSGGMRLNLHV